MIYRAAAILAIPLALSGCAAPAHQAPPAANTPSAADTRLSDWEDENAIDTESWYSHVTKADIEGSAIWVYTDLPNTAQKLAGGMCGAYSTYTVDDPSVTVVFVRASDGMRLAKCGPGA